jgi:hypothetical protein
MAFVNLDAHWLLLLSTQFTCLSASMWVHFVKALYRIKELQSGDYMVIFIDDFILDAEGSNAHKYTSSA